MSEKLKTLKDLTYNTITKDGVYILIVKEAMLKKEAIKWIKALDDKGDTEEPEEGFGATEYGSRMNVVKWIKHFFNISDKEVKENE